MRTDFQWLLYLQDALAQLGYDSSTGADGIYVGDKAKDVRAGTAVGFETAFVRRPHNRDQPRPEDATYELDSLAELLEVVDARSAIG